MQTSTGYTASEKATTLGEVSPGTRVLLARSNEDVVVKAQDGDDFDDWTLCYCPMRAKRSMDDSRQYQFARDIRCFILTA